jgi:hypothetical protein
LFLGNSYRLKQTQTFCEYSVNRTFLDCEPQLFLKICVPKLDSWIFFSHYYNVNMLHN